ncbi:MAG TPA: FAD:protein FMN transferase [bacterium]|nr:FAD:protein FMN transferase [bacterium]
MTRKSILLSAAAALLLIPAVAFPALTDAKNPSPESSQGGLRQFEMQTRLFDGTPVEITIAASSSDEARARAAISAAANRAEAFYRGVLAEGNAQDQLNALPPGKPIELSPDAFALLSKAIDIAAVTGGWYDPAAPSPKGRFTQRDWRRIRLNADSRTATFRSDDMKLDLRPVSLGFAADLAMESLESQGFTNARVGVGPVCRIAGRDIFTPWKLQVGFGANSEAAGTQEASKFAHRAFDYNVTNVAASTVTAEGLGSGLVDPKNKKPVEAKKMKSVTVMAADATTAAAYSLAAWTLGPRIGMRFIEAHPEVKGVLVDSEGQLFASEGLGVAGAQPAASAEAEGTGEPSRPIARDMGPADLKQKKAEEEREM